MSRALFEKVKYGTLSSYLSKPSFMDLRKMKGADLIGLFRDVQCFSCDLYYCGTLPPNAAAAFLGESLPVRRVIRPVNAPAFRPLEMYDAPTVYFCEAPDTAQSIVQAYIPGDAIKDKRTREAARLFTGYFGSGMSSILFQEIREFRSYAYRTGGRYSVMPLPLADMPGEFSAQLSTQNDKTTDAMAVLDALIRNMPVRPERFPSVKQTLVNRMTDEYPTFRRIPARIASLINNGFKSDPNKDMYKALPSMTMDDIVRFHEEQIKWRPIIYAVTGNSHKINLKKLTAFGKVVRVKKEELYR
jgi:predicted Zn-dependent peptidase